MGFAAFGGLTAKGNDDKRLADMKAFASAMEVVRAKAGASVYSAPAATDFAGGIFPTESTGRTEKYAYTDGTAAIANPTLASFTGLVVPNAGSGNGTAWMNVSGTVPTVSATATYFKFCTLKEAKAAQADVICQGNRQ